MCIPLKFGSGTRIKIIEALSIGTIIISTSKGIEGIKLKNKNPPYIANDKKKFIDTLTQILKNFDQIKNKSNRNKTFYKNNYSMEKITTKFIKTNLRRYFNEIKN